MSRFKILSTLKRLLKPKRVESSLAFQENIAFRKMHLNGSFDSIKVDEFLTNPMPAYRLSAIWAITYHVQKSYVNRLEDMLKSERRMNIRLHLYAALKVLGAIHLVKASPRGHRKVLGFDGVRNLELACEETSARLEHQVDELHTIWSKPGKGDPINNGLFNGTELDPIDSNVFQGMSRSDRLNWVYTLGLSGNPVGLPHLCALLFRMDFDPGHGFAIRSYIATAIGGLGFPVCEVLSKALIQEALEYEGRPGSGLGIQRPVRSYILRAIGECEVSMNAMSLLIDYSGNQTGAAMGGYYLESMNALWKIQHVKLEHHIRGLEEIAQFNVTSVFATYGPARLTQAFGAQSQSVYLKAREVFYGASEAS